MKTKEIFTKKIDLEKLPIPNNYLYAVKSDYSKLQLLDITDTVNRILKDGAIFEGLVVNVYDELMAIFSKSNVLIGGYTFYWHKQNSNTKVLNLC